MSGTPVLNAGCKVRTGFIPPPPFLPAARLPNLTAVISGVHSSHREGMKGENGMANLSSLTRKAQVLAYLRDHIGTWVDGPELANERVGGSEGHRRLRELRSDGYTIEERRHPDPARDIWQYRLAGTADRIRVEREGHPDQYIYPRKAQAEAIDNERRAMQERARQAALSKPRIAPGTLRVSFGDVICRTCKGAGGNMIDACLRCGGKGIEA